MGSISWQIPMIWVDSDVVGVEDLVMVMISDWVSLTELNLGCLALI